MLLVVISPSLFPYTTLFRSNDTKVLPARLFGVKEETGAKIELLLLKQLEEDEWEALVKPAKRIKEGDRIRLDRKSTRLNSSHVANSYAVFCLKQKSIGKNNE